jgi:signal transduction histidine kinase
MLSASTATCVLASLGSRSPGTNDGSVGDLTGLRGALWGLAAAGLAFGLADLALILTSDFIELRGAWAAVGLLIGWSFIGTGLFAWARRPDNRVGALMTGTGFGWLVAGLGISDVPLLFTLGSVLGSVYLVVAIQLLFAFPDGNLHTRGERRIVAVGYLLTTIGVLPAWFFSDPADFDCDDCPENVLLIESSKTTATVLTTVVNVVAFVLIAAVLVTLVRRWRRASAPQRRFLVPVYSAGVALMAALIVNVALQAGGLQSSSAQIAFFIGLIPFGLVPWLFLGTLARAKMIQGGAVGELIARLGESPRPGELRDALAKALGDPSLELVYWLPEAERYVDAEGRPYELPEEGSSRAFTRVEREGARIGAIVYDASLRDAGDYVRAVGAAAALALANERLDAELRAKLEELRASRQRMLSIGLEERRRLERDLHDGAQQRLVSMALNLRLARSKLREDPDAADRLLEGAGDELDAALAELRELARGIHPAVLTDRGLDTALATLVSRAPLPVELAAIPGERLPEAVELAAYFVVAEALTNVAKYAEATRATVSVERSDGRIVVEVADDGVGGADPEQGTGLRGLADRLAILEGRLDVRSERGRGTTVTARIPCE